jgi:hypothetical protein
VRETRENLLESRSREFGTPCGQRPRSSRGNPANTIAGYSPFSNSRLYRALVARIGREAELTVRSSASAEQARARRAAKRLPHRIVHAIASPTRKFSNSQAGLGWLIPFCRAVGEGKKVLEQMARNDLPQGGNGLEVYAMHEISANAVLAEQFLKVFDGHSIDSNDLTQLTIGLDRDSGTVAPLFDENNAAVRRMIAHAIRAAREARKPIGICGQRHRILPNLRRRSCRRELTRFPSTLTRPLRQLFGWPPPRSTAACWCMPRSFSG